jgi:hypothetical protein
LEASEPIIKVQKSKPATNVIDNYTKLYNAHHFGIIRLLIQFQDQHRINQYGMLWETVMCMMTQKQFPFSSVLEHYEAARQRHAGVHDCVGAFDSEVALKTLFDAYRNDRPASTNRFSQSSNNYTVSTSSTSSVVRPVGERQAVCIPFNDGRCSVTASGVDVGCPKGLPHLCCRCYEAHAASRDCSLPDPRRGARGKRAGVVSKSKSKSTSVGTAAGQTATASTSNSNFSSKSTSNSSQGTVDNQ